MHTWTAFLPLLAPLMLGVVAVLGVSRSATSTVLAASRIAGIGGLAVAAVGILIWLTLGPLTSPLVGAEGMGLAVRLDGLSVTLFTMAAFLGLILLRYSSTYLQGHPRHAQFMGRFALTLAMVQLLLLSGNLVQLVGAWVLTSWALHGLLIFAHDRPRARLAARKKAIAARSGEACLVVATGLLISAFGTGDIATIAAVASSMSGGDVSPSIIVAGWLLVLAALLKSAQLPTHSWLPEVMDAPTPVSALLHAGIINAGGFLILRFADVALLAPSALLLMAIVGGLTAILAGLVQNSQSSVKVALAWSTVAQMGFMCFEIGIGAFSLALLHIVAHSCYKAYAFLAAGSAIDRMRSAWAPPAPYGQPLARLVVASVVAMAIGATIGAGLQAMGLVPDWHTPGIALGLILLLSSAWLMAHISAEGWPLIGRAVLTGMGVTLIYSLMKAIFAAIATPSLPPIQPASVATLIVATVMVAACATVLVLQVRLPRIIASERGRRWWVHLRNGCYAHLWFDRLAGAHRIPSPASAPTPSVPQPQGGAA